MGSIMKGIGLFLIFLAFASFVPRLETPFVNISEMTIEQIRIIQWGTLITGFGFLFSTVVPEDDI